MNEALFEHNCVNGVKCLDLTPFLPRAQSFEKPQTLMGDKTFVKPPRCWRSGAAPC
jgi:hypothetical protein